MTSTNIASKKLRIGVVGAGEVVEHRLLPALARIPEAMLWSVASRNDDHARHVAEKFIAKAPNPAYSSLQLQLCDSALDALIIAVPDALHADMAVMAARAGKHVFVEKPLATTSADARRIIVAANKAKVILMVGYHLRHHAGHKVLKKALANNAIGRLRHARLVWTYQAPPNDWRKSGESGKWWALAAVGTHAIDLAGWFSGEHEGPASIIVRNVAEASEREHTAQVLLTFTSGFSADIFVSNRETRERSIELFGIKGYACAKDTLGAYGKGSIWVNGHALTFKPVDPYEAELRHFVRTIRMGRNPKAGGKEGLWNVECLEKLS